MSIKRLLIPAAGRGARLDRPGMPKPLVWVAGLPMIVRTLVQAEEAGVEGRSWWSATRRRPWSRP